MDTTFDPFAAQRELNRAQMLARMLQDQGPTQSPVQVVSGRVVPYSPLVGLMDAGKQLLSAYAQRNLIDKQTEYEAQKRKAIADMLTSRGGNPGTTATDMLAGSSGDDDATLSANYGSQARWPVPNTGAGAVPNPSDLPDGVSSSSAGSSLSTRHDTPAPVTELAVPLGQESSGVMADALGRARAGQVLTDKNEVDSTPRNLAAAMLARSGNDDDASLSANYGSQAPQPFAQGGAASPRLGVSPSPYIDQARASRALMTLVAQGYLKPDELGTYQKLIEMGKPPADYGLRPGENRYSGSDNSIVALNPANPQQFTLGPDQTRFDNNGNVIAAGGPRPEQFGERSAGINPATGKPEYFVTGRDGGTKWLGIAPVNPPSENNWQILTDPKTLVTFRYNPVTAEATTLDGKPYKPDGAQRLGGGGGPRSGIGMAMQKFIAENPDATSADVARFAGVYNRTVQQVGADTRANANSLSNITKLYDASTAQNQAMEGALGIIENLMNQGAGTSLGPVVNRWLQAGRKGVGSPDVAAFDTAVRTAVGEYAKIMTGASGAAGSSDAARKEAADMLDKLQSPDAIRAQIGVIRKDSEFKRRSYEDQLRSIRERINDPATGASQQSVRRFNPQTGRLDK